MSNSQPALAVFRIQDIGQAGRRSEANRLTVLTVGDTYRGQITFLRILLSI